ncbi:efflux RND transporter periplasmic adaptor subunit [Desulfonema magnum]|uniref:Efflux transporter, RND family n=1 Tax=Desulfonema magnum TaxID=45655 RepID=A0A975BVY6_9BACT|nr:efflux RND transporter periplasmic adaptor subunit [Desulfonema magnum]QTA92751.1 Efflux transporter, RND family [Desulfonema magnum]
MRTFFKFILILLILAAGGFIAKTLIATKPSAKRKPVSIGAPLADVITVQPGAEQVKIIAMGTVVPAKEVVIQPQVSGHIVEISPELMPGGLFKAGDVLMRIDDRDYKIAADQRNAEVARAMMELKLEQGKQATAKREWELLGSEIATTKSGRDLVLRKPHLKKAVASLASARSSLKKAKLDVERTKIRASFNAFVKEKFVDIGQPAGPGTKLVTLVGTDEFWLQISVPVRRLSWISVPGVNATEGSFVTVIQENNAAGSQIVRQGKVVRLLGDLDPVGRMARILVAVEDPFDLNTEKVIKNIPLLLGAYVKVEIQGPELENVFVIPRKALREGEQVWLMTHEKKLSIRKVDVVWRRKDDLLVRGLNSGEHIITSRISAPVEGMELRVSGPDLQEADTNEI